MNPITRFFHELLNPHCQHCENLKIQEQEQKELDREINSICPTCEVLKIELAKSHEREGNLIIELVKFGKPIENNAIINQEQPKIINRTNHVPWSVMRQKLEKESREEARRIKDEALKNAAKPDSDIIKNIEKIEEEIGITNAG